MDACKRHMLAAAESPPWDDTEHLRDLEDLPDGPLLETLHQKVVPWAKDDGDRFRMNKKTRRSRNPNT